MLDEKACLNREDGFLNEAHSNAGNTWLLLNVGQPWQSDYIYET